MQQESDDAIQLTPASEISIERGLEIMGEDEYLEITPMSVRLRKQFLAEADRRRSVQEETERSMRPIGLRLSAADNLLRFASC